MAGNNQVRLGIGLDFNVNTASLTKVQDQLKKLRQMSKDDIKAAGGTILDYSDMKVKNANHDLGAMRKELDKLGDAFTKAYNPKLGTVELNKFNQELEKSGTSAQRAFMAVAGFGKEGEAALLDMTTNMLAVDRAAKQVNSTMKQLGDTLWNTVRWSITSSALNAVTGSIQKAYNYALDLDTSLNNIQIVTDKSADDMARFAREANKAAKELGTSTREYTDASLIYYQQGLSDEDVKVRTDITTKVAEITGQSAETVSKQLTAVWNGYKVSAGEAELYVDKLSAVAAETSADLESLATGMSKVASAANTMGVDIDQLSAQIATIESVTQQAPESIGTALKTIYARMGDIESGISDETTLGEYTAQMEAMGVNVLDANGRLREMGDIIEEIGGRWNTMSREQQVALSQIMAGTRQYNNLLALFDNWDMYQKSLNISLEAAGTLTDQHNKKLESTEAHYKQMTAALEGLYDSIFDSEEINRVYDLLKGIIEIIDEIVQSLGGMPGILTALGAMFAKFAKHNIANARSTRQQNKLSQQLNKQQLENGRKIIEQLKERVAENANLQEHLEKVLELEEKIYNKADNLTDDQWAHLQNGIKGYQQEVQKTIDLEKELVAARTAKDEYWRVETRQTRKSDGSGKATKNKYGKGSYSLYTAEGVIAARNRRNEVQGIIDKQKAESGSASKRYTNEVKWLNRIIKLAEEENAEWERQNKILTKTPGLIEEQKKKVEALGKILDKTVDADKRANTFANIVDAVASIGFTAQGVSSSITSFYESIRDGEADLNSLLGSISGIAMSLSPFTQMIITAGKAARDESAKAAEAAMASGVAANTAAVGWKAFWASMGPVGWVMLGVTALTTIISLIKSSIDAQEAQRKKQFEEAKEKQATAQANADLAKSYLRLYESYEVTGEVSQELVNSAKQVAEALGIEGAEVLILANKYEELTKQIKNAQQQASELSLVTATQMRTQYEKNIYDSTKGNFIQDAVDYVQGVHFIDLGGRKISAQQEKEVETFLKAQGLSKGGFERGWFGDYIVTNTDSKKAAADYFLVKSLLADNKIQDKEIANLLQTYLIENPNLKRAVYDYEANEKIIASEKIRQNIWASNISSNTSLSTINQQRQQYIDQVQAQMPWLSDEAAAKIVDDQYAYVGGAGAKLSQREQWISAQSQYLSADELNNLRKNLDLNKFSDLEFSVIKSFNVEQYKNDLDGLYNAVAERVKQIHNETWAALTDERLAALDKELTRLEKLGDGKNLDKQINNLLRQEQILQSTWDTQKTTYENKKDDFEQALNKAGIDNTDLINALNGEDWESAAKILKDELVIDEDIRQDLLNDLGVVMTANNALAESEAQMLETYDLVIEKKIESLEKVSESYETQISYLEQMNSLLEHQKTLIELYGDTDLTSYYNGVVANAAEIQAINKSSYEYWRNLYDSQKDNATEEELEVIKSSMLAAGEAYAASITNYASVITEQLQNTISQRFSNYTFELTGRSANLIAHDWEWDKQARTTYLSPLDSKFGKDKLSRSYRDAINDTNNINAQTRITNLMKEQLDILEKHDKLTQYDLDRAQKKLELLQAEIALQEAQDAKTQMRLIRGADGTYSYEYVADEAAVTAAEDRVASAMQDIYQSDLEAYESNLDEFNSLYGEYEEKMKEFAAGGINEEEKAILQDYLDRLNVLAGANERYKTNLSTSITEAASSLGIDPQEYIKSLITDNGLQKFVAEWAINPDKQLTFETFQSDIDNASTSLQSLNELLNGTNGNGLLQNLEALQTEVTTLTDSYKNQVTAISENGEMTAFFEEFAKWLKDRGVTAFASGGLANFTGPAWLDGTKSKPELVLNPGETQDFVGALSILRGLNISMMQNIAGFNRFTTPRINGVFGSTPIEQTVYITAEFPDTTDAEAIKEAFNDLVSLAEQKILEK